MNIRTGKIAKPQRVVFYGVEGIGKTTFGAQFPKPIFIDLEGSTTHIDVARTDDPSSWAHLLGIVDELIADQFGFETVVIDTIDWAEKLCLGHICLANGKSSIEDFGYGKGFVILKEEFCRLFDKLSDLSKKMNVCIIAHSHLSRTELPEEKDSYDKHELMLHKKTSAIPKQWCDMLLFGTYETIVVEGKAQGGNRIIHTTHRPTHDAKNRHGLAPKVALDFASIAHCIPAGFSAKAATIEQPVQAQPVQGPVQEKVAEPVQAAVEATPAQEDPSLAGIPKNLADLMQKDGITAEDIQKACHARGYMPIETAVSAYPQEFVGMIVTHWQPLSNEIKKQKGEA